MAWSLSARQLRRDHDGREGARVWVERLLPRRDVRCRGVHRRIQLVGDRNPGRHAGSPQQRGEQSDPDVRRRVRIAGRLREGARKGDRIERVGQPRGETGARERDAHRVGGDFRAPGAPRILAGLRNPGGRQRGNSRLDCLRAEREVCLEIVPDLVGQRRVGPGVVEAIRREQDERNRHELAAIPADRPGKARDAAAAGGRRRASGGVRTDKRRLAILVRGSHAPGDGQVHRRPVGAGGDEIGRVENSAKARLTTLLERRAECAPELVGADNLIGERELGLGVFAAGGRLRARRQDVSLPLGKRRHHVAEGRQLGAMDPEPVDVRLRGVEPAGDLGRHHLNATGRFDRAAFERRHRPGPRPPRARCVDAVRLCGHRSASQG